MKTKSIVYKISLSTNEINRLMQTKDLFITPKYNNYIVGVHLYSNSSQSSSQKTFLGVDYFDNTEKNMFRTMISADTVAQKVLNLLDYKESKIMKVNFKKTENHKNAKDITVTIKIKF